MMISAGMRTDIPAFYGKWLINRLNASFVCVKNPYNERQITEYKLNPEVVDWDNDKRLLRKSVSERSRRRLLGLSDNGNHRKSNRSKT